LTLEKPVHVLPPQRGGDLRADVREWKFETPIKGM